MTKIKSFQQDDISIRKKRTFKELQGFEEEEEEDYGGNNDVKQQSSFDILLVFKVASLLFLPHYEKQPKLQLDIFSLI